MKKIASILLFFIVAVFALPGDAEIPFKDGDRVLFLGDSITQAGHYVVFIETYLWAQYPERNIEVFNIGLSSETASGRSETSHPGKRPWIHDRLDACLEVAQPDWVVVCYGMNDGIYCPPSEEGLTAYQDGMKRLISRIEAEGAEVMLLTPPPYDAETQRMRGVKLQPIGADSYGYTSPYEDYDDVLAGYADWILSQSGEVAAVADLHAPMRAYIEECRRIKSSYRYGDGVHPPPAGHYRMALAFLEALGEDFHAARTLLTHVTGQALYPDEESKPKSELLSELFVRGAALNAAYRVYVATEDHGGNNDALEEALALAKQREDELRPQVVERARKVAAPADSP